MGPSAASAIAWLFGEQQGPPTRLIPRWLFLRALGAIYFSAFFSLLFQIRGLIGPAGILPASDYLREVALALPPWGRLWYVPTLLWFSSSNQMLGVLCWAGIIASVLLVLNFWPRGMLGICFICFLSFVSAAQDFSGYQSDGMLLEAGFISIFFAPPGLRPKVGEQHPASRASCFLLLWEWFRIYFESGVVKLLSGEPQWRNATAMDEYYQNGPLPTWIGWYVQHLPHWFHAGSVYATLILEIGLVWMLFLPRRWRYVIFVIATVWQLGVILTANYTFLNYLVLVLGFLLLDDSAISRVFERARLIRPISVVSEYRPVPLVGDPRLIPVRRYWKVATLGVSVFVLSWVFYVTTAQLILMFSRVPLPAAPVVALEPFRIANRYGLFAVMTRGRYEIEFQGSDDGQTWVVYRFRHKPQRMDQPPGIYAPYQPRFDWNLWFASLGSWREYPIVPATEERLLSNDEDVLSLFANNPFAQHPPRQIRVVLWQYWFTSMAEKRASGIWWKREWRGLYAPTLEQDANGNFKVVEWPTVGSHE